jgi:3-methyladenine DNA glycosylase AlkC
MATAAEGSYALKDGFSQATVEAIARQVRAAAPRFDVAAFTAGCMAGFEELSLMARVRRVAEGLQQALPQDFAGALAVVEKALGPAPVRSPEGEGIAAFARAPFLEFVALAGVAQPDVALPALQRLTRHFTAEFAIRPFLEQHLEDTLAQVQRWVHDEDWRVRRLASEGTRPLLPWGRHVAALKRQPQRCLGLIGPLAADASEVVRRSAANHLNDVSRLDVDLALEHAQRWAAQAGEAGQQTVRHALRTLVKSGDARALGMLGYHVGASVTLAKLKCSSKRVRIGETLTLSFELRSQAPQPVLACVDYAIRYAGARGGTDRCKVFKGAHLQLLPGQPQHIEFKRDFVPRTTRRLYPGRHEAQVLVNGAVLGTLGFDLLT